MEAVRKHSLKVAYTDKTWLAYAILNTTHRETFCCQNTLQMHSNVNFSCECFEQRIRRMCTVVHVHIAEYTYVHTRR